MLQLLVYFREEIRERGRQAVTAYMNAFRDLKNFIVDVK